jgi:hypothetical protein
MENTSNKIPQNDDLIKSSTLETKKKSYLCMGSRAKVTSDKKYLELLIIATKLEDDL